MLPLSAHSIPFPVMLATVIGNPACVSLTIRCNPLHCQSASLVNLPKGVGENYFVARSSEPPDDLLGKADILSTEIEYVNILLSHA